MKTAKGSFGGQATTQASSPKESDDTLHNTQFAWIIDVLSEGPIGGYCDRNWNVLTNPNAWPQAVFFNQTQLMTDSGQFNYSGIQVGEQLGWDVQSVYTNFTTAGDTVSIGIQLFKNQPITFSIEDPNTTRVSIGIRLPTLEQQQSNGNIVTYSVTIAIFCSLNGGILTPVGPNTGNFTINGKCSSDYTQEFNFILPRSTDPQQDYWQIQVQRASADDSDSKHRSVTVLDYYTRIVDANLMYPGTAYAVVGINSQSLSSIPARGYRIKGRLIQVPTNYFPDTRKYTRYFGNGGDTGAVQPWNGTFWTAWSNNPAWVFYDICTNTRYGAGQFIGSNIDIWALYEIAQYCDELVPNGTGGLEPRFTLNTYVQSQEQAWKVLSDFASTFRGLIYWGGGTIVPVQDRPKPMIQTFTNANVVAAAFVYSDTEIKNRQSDATVQWNDPADFFNQKLERVTDQASRVKFGMREAQFAAFGCTSRGQAARAGNYFLVTNQTETETVVFQTGLEALYLHPGDIIGISDNDRIGFRAGGRIVSYNTATSIVTLDSPIPAQPDAQQIWFYAAQNTQTSADVPIGNQFASEIAESNHPPLAVMGFIYRMAGLASNKIFVQPYSTNTFPPVGSQAATGPVDLIQHQYGSPETTLGATLGAVIVPGAVWVLSSNFNTPNNLPLALFRIIDITEKDTHLFQITGVTYNQGKYDEVDFGYQFAPPLLTKIAPITNVLKPNNLTAAIKATVQPEGVRILVELNWEPPPDGNIRSYQVFIQNAGGAFVYYTETAATTIDIPTPIPSFYTYKVVSINVAAVASPGVQVSIDVPDAPSIANHRISGLELNYQGNDTIYHTLDALIDWRLNSPSRYFELSSQEPYGASSGGYDPYFKNFVISVYDADTGVLGWTDTTTDLIYSIAYAKNAAAWGDGNPRHRLTVVVQATNTYNVPSPVEIITIDNPPPDAPLFLTVAGSGGRASLQWVAPYAADAIKINIYMSATPLATDAILIASTSNHASSFTTSPLTPGTYYFSITQQDTFGSESNKTGLVSVNL